MGAGCNSIAVAARAPRGGGIRGSTERTSASSTLAPTIPKLGHDLRVEPANLEVLQDGGVRTGHAAPLRTMRQPQAQLSR
jgi:hypothetical protein